MPITGTVPESQLIPYGYTIFSYMSRYNQAWISDVQRLKTFLSQNCGDKGVPFVVTETYYVTSATSIGLEFFPDENIRQILSYFNHVDLGVACNVCPKWNELASREELWCTLLENNFRISPSDITVRSIKYRGKDTHVSSKQIYREMVCTLRGVIEGMDGPKMRQPAVSAELLYFTAVL